MVEAGRRQAVAEAAEIGGEMALDRARERLGVVGFAVGDGDRRLVELGLDDVLGDRLLRVEGRKAAASLSAR